jgi:hypothetical protein
MRKLHNDGIPIDVTDRLPALLEMLRAVPGFVALFLYGSYGTPFQTPLSDVDLAILFRRNEVPGARAHLELVGQILACLREDDVSILTLNTAPLALQFQVVSKGRLLAVHDEIALADFLEVLFDRYGDFAIDHEAFLVEYDRALVEELGHGAR